jgi:predicted RNase H-like HicB family nuclease
LQGCHAEGETYLKALENIQDIIRIHLESRAELEALTSEQAEVASVLDTFKVDLMVPVNVSPFL